jgi:hypothetical protein
MTFHTYEDWGIIPMVDDAPLLEAFTGAAVVQWHGNIERQLLEKIEKSEKERNFPYADKVRKFLQIWRDNELTGSINREQVETLKAACDILAVDSWNLSNYFSNLQTQLRRLIASVEELPTFDQENEPGGPAGGMGTPGGPPPDFGPEDEAPEMDASGKPLDPAQGDNGAPEEQDIDGALKAMQGSGQGQPAV